MSFKYETFLYCFATERDNCIVVAIKVILTNTFSDFGQSNVHASYWLVLPSERFSHKWAYLGNTVRLLFEDFVTSVSWTPRRSSLFLQKKEDLSKDLKIFKSTCVYGTETEIKL